MCAAVEKCGGGRSIRSATRQVVQKARAISQDFRALLKPLSHGFQLLRLESGFASSPAGLLESCLPLALPLLVPPPGRLTGYAGLARNLGLADSSLKELRRTESSLLQLVEILLNTTRIAPAQEGSTGNE